LDLYRLETPDQVQDAGLVEYLQPDGVSVIEWAEKYFPNKSPVPNTQSLAAPFRKVQIEILNESERRISYEDFGA
jgi:tRNA A37 threonylcarbamoyladenosine biosynthesis protein TsaE